MGVSGAGKSVVGAALARALGAAFVDGDDVHPPRNLEKMARGIPLTDADRAGWLAALAARIAESRVERRGLVVACSALKRAYRDVLRSGAPELRFVHLTGPRALIAERLIGRRGHFMPASLLDTQFATLEPPGDDEQPWTYDVAQPPDAIVDAIVRRATHRAPA